MRVTSMWRCLLLALLLVGGIGVLPARALAESSILYSARWSGGLAGWQPVGDSGWTIRNGMPAYGDHTGAADLLAPYRLGSLKDFAVEAQIERIGNRGTSLAHAERGYGVFVRGSGQQGANVAGGFFFGELNGSNAFFPQSALDWGGSVLRGADVALHDGFNTFRLEVHGDHYALYENGVLTVQATVGGFLGDRAGIFSRQYRIRVRSFRVIALPARSARGGPTASLLSSLSTLNLQAKEAPAGLHKSFGEYYTNDEIAAERGVSVDSLRQSGRLLSYQIEYRQLLNEQNPRKGYKAIDCTVAAFRTPAGALADYTAIRSSYQGSQFHVTSPGTYGTTDFLATYAYPFRGRQYSSYDLGFVRGAHRVAVSVNFVKGSVSAIQALQWLDSAARKIDARLQ